MVEFFSFCVCLKDFLVFFLILGVVFGMNIGLLISVEKRLELCWLEYLYGF